MCHLSSFSSLKSFSLAHLALSRGQGGSQHMLTPEEGCLPSFQPCPRTLVTQSWEAETLYRSLGPPVCKFHRVVRRLESTQRIRKRAPSPAYRSQEPFPLVSMDTFNYAQNATHRPLSPLFYGKAVGHTTASTLFSHTYRGTNGWPEAPRICLSLVHVYCVHCLQGHKEMSKPKSLTRTRWFSITIVR